MKFFTRHWYNIGLIVLIFTLLFLGFNWTWISTYIYYMVSNNLVRGFDWVIAVLGLVASITCVNIITYRLFPNRNTKFVFDEVEMKIFI